MALTRFTNSLTVLKSLAPSSAKYSACVNRSCVVLSGPSPRVNRYMENAMEDMFLARRTTSLSGSSHLSVSASISDVISFISRPSLAIFACSWVANHTNTVWSFLAKSYTFVPHVIVRITESTGLLNQFV